MQSGSYVMRSLADLMYGPASAAKGILHWCMYAFSNSFYLITFLAFTVS
jgi:hypothetical protein